MSFGARIKIYGERNSGTNYLTNIIKKNIEIVVMRGAAGISYPREEDKDRYFAENYNSTLGWKHGLAVQSDVLNKEIYDGVFIVTISKNPYAWLKSLHKRPYHEAPCDNFHDFIRRRPSHLGRSVMASPSFNLVALWNEKCRSYLALPDERHYHITYERLIADPRGFIDYLAKRTETKTSNNYFSNISMSTKPTDMNFEDYRNFYLSEAWLSDYTDADVEFVSSEVDADIMRHFDYSIL